MNLKDRIKTTSFWAGLIGTVILILSAFGVEVGDDTTSAIINAVCSALAVFGIVKAPAPADGEQSESDEGEISADEISD